MLPRWGKAIAQFSRSYSQNNTKIQRPLCSFSCRDYSKVAPSADSNVVGSTEKDRNSTPQVNLNNIFWSKPRSLALAPDSPLKIEEPQYDGIKRFLLKLMLFYSKQSTSIRRANVIYRRVIHQVDRPAIYDDLCSKDVLKNCMCMFLDQCGAFRELLRFLGSTMFEYMKLVKDAATIEKDLTIFSLEKTFKTTFSLLVIHMWLCLRRLKQEGKEGVELGQNLYEIYNHDLELRVSKAGVNLLLTKWMKDLEKIFYGNIVAYDAAMLPEAKQDELQNVIWRNVFSDDDTSWPNDAALLPVQGVEHLDQIEGERQFSACPTYLLSLQAMTRYVRRESNCLSLTDREAVISGDFMFSSLENTNADKEGS